MQVGRRIFLDLSMVLSWRGPVVGMIRAESELAKFALAERPDVEFVCYSRSNHAYMKVPLEFVRQSLDALSTLRPNKVALAQDDLKFLQNPRKFTYFWLERERYRAVRRGDRLAAEAMRALSSALNKRKRRDPGPNAHIDVPMDAICSERAPFDRNSILFTGGNDWISDRVDAIAQARAATGLKVALLCYDLTPISSARYHTEFTSRSFTSFFARASAMADAIICISDAVRSDVVAYCTQRGLRARVLSSRLGSDALAGEGPMAPLPRELEPGRFVLFVSTLEARKNHRLAFDVWERLCQQGIPQRAGMKLVFAGRAGWLTDDLMSEMRATRWLNGQLVHLDYVTDNLLARLYQDCAFTIYPSAYEGYGLPAVEALNAGKVCLASDSGALAEVIDGLSPTLDYRDFNAWAGEIERLMLDPEYRSFWEERIRREYRVRTWTQAGADMFSAVASIERPPAECAPEPVSEPGFARNPARA